MSVGVYAALFTSRMCQVRDGVEDSNAEIRFFNNKVKQKNINHPEGEKQAGRKAEDWSTVKHQTQETHMT